MDELSHRADELSVLARKINLESRLARFSIGSETVNNIRQLRPVLHRHVNGIAQRFYVYMQRFSEAQRIFAGQNMDRLRTKQITHWRDLFLCEFDENFLMGALAVGFAHYKAKVPPHLYMAGYNFFTGELLRILVDEIRPAEIAAAAISVNKLVSFDMSIGLNSYMMHMLLHPDWQPEPRHEA